MTRRTLLQTLLGSGLQAAAVPLARWPGAPTRPYRTVGRNPRGAPVLSWHDALSYMQNHPKFQKDLTVLLPQGLDPAVREAYWPRIVRDVRGSVELAEAHHFMQGTCPICSAKGCAYCEEAVDLSHRFQRLAIPRGTRYLALTEGQDGRVTFNRVFLGDAIAYRVNVLDGKAFIDLIARCRNTALGERQEWEAYTAFTPPAPGAVPLPPPTPVAAAPPPVREAVAGSTTTNNYYPAAPPPMAYISPGQPQFYPRNYQAGSLYLWFRPDVRVGITQAAPAGTASTGAARAQANHAALTPLAAGPTTFTTPAVAGASGRGLQSQSPVAAASSAGPQVQGPVATASGPQTQGPIAPSALQLPAPVAAQGTGSPTQGPQQH